MGGQVGARRRLTPGAGRTDRPPAPARTASAGEKRCGKPGSGGPQTEGKARIRAWTETWMLAGPDVDHIAGELEWRGRVDMGLVFQERVPRGTAVAQPDAEQCVALGPRALLIHEATLDRLGWAVGIQQLHHRIGQAVAQERGGAARIRDQGAEQRVMGRCGEGRASLPISWAMMASSRGAFGRRPSRRPLSVSPPRSPRKTWIRETFSTVSWPHWRRNPVLSVCFHAKPSVIPYCLKSRHYAPHIH